MPPNEEETMKIIKDIAAKMEKPVKIDEVIYRADYQDYQVIVNEHSHCEIREKLINDYIALKHEDVDREIKYLLQNAVAFEEWEERGSGGGGGGGGGGEGDYRSDVAVDDSADYDF